MSFTSSPTLALDFIHCFLTFKETSSFQEKKAFNTIKELGFLSYYKDFKLLLYNSYFCPIFPSIKAFKSHLNKDLSLIPLKEKKSLISQALLIFNTLEVSSYKKNIELISLFQVHFTLVLFKELKLIDLFTCNFPNCSIVLSNEYRIKRHFQEAHKGSKIDPIYKAIKGHSLEATKFFFKIKSSESLSSVSNSPANIIEASSPIIEASSLSSVKDAFLARFSQKEQGFLEELNSFTLDSREKLSPFQIKTRYVEYISKYNIQDLQSLVVPVTSEEKVLEVLVLNLKEILYLSLEKSIFLNKIHLNILNSFEDNKIRNKPFKPLLNTQTRVKYFNFFSSFFIFFFRALSKSLETDISYFKVTQNIVSIFRTLISLVNRKIEADDNNYLELSNKSFQESRKTINNKLNKAKFNLFLNNIEDNSSNKASSTSSETTSSSLSSSLNSTSSPSSSDSSSSINSALLESSNIEVLKKIQEINKSRDSLSVKIKDLLLELIISLLKQSTDLNIFDSSINSFFASISIGKNKAIKDSLLLSQDYSKFIYSVQVLTIEYCFSELFKDNSLELTTLLRTFRDKYLNNSTNSALSEVLNNRAYCFRINREISTLNYISISSTSKETVSYKKITLSSNDLRTLFSSVLSSTYSILKEKLLFNIPKFRYKDINLSDYSKYEDRSNTTPFKCFRDFCPNSIHNSEFLRSEILANKALLNQFFILVNNNLELNSEKVKVYLADLLEFKKLCLLCIYLTTGLPLRGTELVTLRFLNSIKDIREIFLDISSSLFIVNISYYKGQTLSEKRASNIRYLPPYLSEIILLYIVLIDPFIEFLNISLLSSKKLKSIKSLIPYFFFVNNKLLGSRDLSLKLNSYSSLVLGQKIRIQIYRQVIITIIKEFMLEKLNLNTLFLEEDKSHVNELVAAQYNHSLNIEDLTYGRNSLVFKNINSNLQYKYLAFCLRYFTYFKINSSSSQVETYKTSLRIKDVSE